MDASQEAGSQSRNDESILSSVHRRVMLLVFLLLKLLKLAGTVGNNVLQKLH